MADKEPVSPVKAQEPATTREEMDFEDNNEHEQETGTVSPLGHETATTTTNSATTSSPRPRVSFQDADEEIPPQKPPRPTSPQQQAENTLIEAFPSIDTKVVKAVLIASGGKVEPAFNALLGMSDPDFRPDEAAAAPPQPPRPVQQQRRPQNQLEADELYARQLAEQYNNQHQQQYSAARGQTRYNQREEQQRRPNQQRPPYDEEDREHSFFDDDLPEIGRNLQQTFVETQKKMGSWINNLRKKIDGEDEEDDLYSGGASQSGPRRQGSAGVGTGRQNFGSSQSEQMYGIRKSAEANASSQRRSTEAQRYDADPHELGDEEFERLEMRDDEDEGVPPPQPPRSSSRKTANPDLFKSTPRPPQSGPVDEVDAAERKNPDGSGKKWQALTSVAPNPEEDNDPFSVGDDEEEKGGEEVRKDDTERLKEQARECVSAGAGEAGKGLEESERSGSSGTKNKEMEELLGGGKKE